MILLIVFYLYDSDGSGNGGVNGGSGFSGFPEGFLRQQSDKWNYFVLMVVLYLDYHRIKYTQALQSNTRYSWL